MGRHLIAAYRLTCHCAPTRLRDLLEKKDVMEIGLSYDQIEVLLGEPHEIRSAASQVRGKFCSFAISEEAER